MAAYPFLVSPTVPAALRPRGVVAPAAAGSAACSCCCFAPRIGGLLLRPPSAREPRRHRAPATHPVRFCASIASGWPVVLAGSMRRGFGKGLSATAMDADAGDQATEGAGDDDEVRITNENLRATIRKSKEVLAMHRNLMEQISEKKKLISVIVDSSIHNEHEPFSGQSNSSFSEGGHQAYIDMHERQSEFDTTYEEFIDGQNEHYESFEGEDTDFRGSASNYLYDSFHRASPSINEPEVANGMNQHYVAQLSQVSEKEHSVNVGGINNTPASGGVDVLNIILVAAECAPWSKTGGLGDVAGALPKALARRGHRVMIFGLAAWEIWMSRNNKIFRGIAPTMVEWKSRFGLSVKSIIPRIKPVEQEEVQLRLDNFLSQPLKLPSVKVPFRFQYSTARVPPLAVFRQKKKKLSIIHPAGDYNLKGLMFN